ncbi:MAG: glycoside hydrolase family 88 protein [Planctomycetota bacterium]|nr:glycoside hydrolase family 88 protein [Planctomycetota bacterium]
MNLTRVPVTLAGAAQEDQPPGRIGLAGLPVFHAHAGAELSAPALVSAEQRHPRHLLLVVAADCRYDATLTLGMPSTGWHHAVELSFSSVAQRLYVELPREVIARLHETPLQLKSYGEAPVWFVAPRAGVESLVPHLLMGSVSGNPRAAMDRLAEPALAPFGWMGGCIVEALEMWAKTPNGGNYARALDAWFARYLSKDSLVYDGVRSERIENRFESIEATLPIASIARRSPGHPALDAARRFWDEARKPDGSVRDHSFTAEGSYTVAYPMMALGKRLNDAALCEDALRQLRMRRENLIYQGDLYLRALNGGRSYRNWARGIAWYLLGLVHTLREAGPDAPADLREHLNERAAWIRSRMRSDFLWDNFLDEPGAPPDASGSCGIAAALMAAWNAGLLNENPRSWAESTSAAALQLLHADGYLGSVAPNNKRGEAVQHLARRTCEPFALGLLAQLLHGLASGTSDAQTNLQPT